MKEDVFIFKIKKQSIQAIGYIIFIGLIICSIFMIGYICGKEQGWNDLHPEIFSKKEINMIVGNCYNGCSTKTFILTTNPDINWREAISPK